RRQTAIYRGVDHVGVRLGCGACAGNPARDDITRDAAEDSGVGDAVTAQTIGAVNATRVLAGGEQARHTRRRIRPELDAAHHVVRSRDHFDAAAREVEAAVGTAFPHSLE